MSSLYGAGSARSDFTTCLLVPWGGWGPLVRSKQAVFRVLIFEQIGILTCLVTAVESARGIKTGSYSAHLSFDSCCTRRTCVCWIQTFFFGCMVRQRWQHWPCFQSSGVWRRMGWMHRKLAHFFGYGWSLDVFFGSSQMDNWLLKYGHFKFWGGAVLQNLVCTWFSMM